MAHLHSLWIVRHGESAGNVLAYEAEAAGAELIDVPDRDPDVALSPTGRAQAEATARWFAALPEAERPEVVVVSPYLRTRQTAEPILAALGLPARRDERLRDRELGVLDRLTSHGVRARMPQEAQRRDRLGKFYYRPPGGESWADVALRLRSLLGDLRRDHAGRRVLLVGHEALIFLLRYLLEELDEAALIALTRREVVGNCSVSGWRCGPDGRFTGVLFNHIDHLREQGTAATSEEEIDAEPV